VSTQVRPVVVHVRTATPAALLEPVRRALAEIAPGVAADVVTLRDATAGETRLRAFGTWLLASAGVIALLLATTGLYGLMAFVVSTRTSEIGTRMALGAASSRILRDVLGDGLRLVGVGVALGAVLSLALATLLRGALAGLSPADPAAFAAAVVVLVAITVTASYVPARRAASLDPVQALRVD
jgi:predicted lysophospholipase L1 biosynthesis ABC-type transport system permease subunit